jgi:hypothetical protein
LLDRINSNQTEIGGSDHLDNALYPYPAEQLPPDAAAAHAKLACAVVQLVRLEHPDQLRKITKTIKDLEINGTPFQPKSWPTINPEWKAMTPNCSGVLTEGNSKILTAAHCAHRLLPNKNVKLYAITGRTLKSDAEPAGHELHRVSKATRYLCSGPPCGEPGEIIDLMVLQLETPISDDRACSVTIAREPVQTGDSVFAQFHPFGLARMCSTAATVTACHETFCTAGLDNGTGGSGGALVNGEGELVGIVSGDVGHVTLAGSLVFTAREQPFTRVSILDQYPENIGTPPYLHLEQTKPEGPKP